MIEVVSATRLSETDFWSRSALGCSLRRLEHDHRLTARVAFANSSGLPDVFNARIAAPDGPDLIVFVHDDVWIDDYFVADRIIEGLQRYDVIGVAGNRRRVPRQPAWAFVDDKFTWDDRANLSGSVAHGAYPFGGVSFFGPVPADCELLDGVLLAARRPMLKANALFFDKPFTRSVEIVKKETLHRTRPVFRPRSHFASALITKKQPTLQGNVG